MSEEEENADVVDREAALHPHRDGGALALAIRQAGERPQPRVQIVEADRREPVERRRRAIHGRGLRA